MSQYHSTPMQRGSVYPALPLILAALLFCGLIFCCWLIWSDSPRHLSRQLEYDEMARLREEEKTLREILLLPPCDAKTRLTGEAAPTSRLEPQTAPPAVRAQSAQRAAPAAISGPAEVENACVFIVSADNDQKLSTGTGFFVAPGYVATNRHVVTNAKGKILVTSNALGKPVFGKVVAVGEGPDEDYALMSVEVPDEARVAIMEFSGVPKRTQRVGAWGFPDVVGKNDPKYAQLMKEGDISAVPELSYTEGVVSVILDRSPRVIVHTAPISTGNSGGPLVNQDGRLVGINTMITLDEDTYRQASIALSSQDLEEFLAENGIRVSTAN